MLALFCPSAFGQAWSGVLASSRAIDWSGAGATITNRTTKCGSTIAAYTGTAATINSAIAACTSGQFVLLGAGTFNLSTMIDFANHSNVTLRGAGANSTVLVFSAAGSCFGLNAQVCVKNADNFAASSPQHTANWTAGYSVGTTSITLSSTTGLTTGANLMLDQLNDSNTDTGNIWVCETSGTCSSEGPAGAERSGRSQVQVVTVTGIAGTTVTFTPGLRMPNWSSGKTPGAWWTNSTITGVGIENLSLDYTASAPTSGILFFNASNSWVKGVKSVDADRNHVWLFQSPHITVRDSYFYATQNSAQESYGIEPYITSDSLIENNIFQHIAAPVTVNGPATGSVIAYNYSTDDYSTLSASSMSGSAWLHSAGVDFLLFEGNNGAGFFGDNIHGTHHFVTLFRNRLAGFETGKSSQTWPLLLAPGSRYFNVVGNVVGWAGYHTTYTGSSAVSEVNLGPAINGLASDSLVASTAMLWGNYDVVNSGTRFVSGEVPSGISLYPNSVPASHTLAASFYLSAKPTWFQNVPYPATGPDVTGGNISGVGGFANEIPAQLCYENTSSTSGVLNFDSDSCYTPSLTFSSLSLSFGNQATGSSSSAQVITVTNISASTVNISDISLPVGSQFSLTKTCGATLTASSTCTISVTFSPTLVGPDSDPLTITSDEPVSPQTVLVDGVGTGTAPAAVSLSPSSLSFTSLVGVTTAAQVVTLTNIGGTTLNISGITFTGPNVAEFAKTTTCGATVAVSGTCTVSITFTPSTLGSKTVTLNVADDASSSPQTVPLNGSGVPLVTPFAGGVIKIGGKVTMGGNSGIAQAPDVLPAALPNEPILPQLWVNSEECAGTTSITKNIPGDYAATQAGLNSAIVAAETARNTGLITGPGTLIQVAHGTLLSGGTTIVLPQTTGDISTNCIIINSDTPPTVNQTVCSQSAITPDPSERNPGCTNDIAKLFTIQMTSALGGSFFAGSVVMTATGAHHYQWSGSELRLLAGAGGGANNGIELFWSPSQADSHIHFMYNYVHGYDTPDTSISRGIQMDGPYESAMYNYCEMIHNGGSGGAKDSQCYLTYRNGGPRKVVMNWLEGSSEAIMAGGVPVPGQASDMEIRRNMFTMDYAWHTVSAGGLSGTRSKTYQIKNRAELKSCMRCLFDGNRLEQNWKDGQNGAIMLVRSSATSNSGNGGFDHHTWDILITNNVLAHAAQGWLIDGMGQGWATDGVTYPMKRVMFGNNLMYDIGDASRYVQDEVAGTLAPLKAATKFVQIGVNGQKFTGCTVVRDAAGLTSTATCPSPSVKAPWLGIDLGEPVRLYSCLSGGASPDPSPVSFSVSGAGVGPLAVAPSTYTSLSVTYPNPGTANATAVSCTVENNSGQPDGISFVHNSFFIARNGGYGSNFTDVNGSNLYYKRHLKWVNNIFTRSGVGLGQFLSEGTSTLSQYDVATETFNSNVLAGRSPGVYPLYPASSPVNYFPGNSTGGQDNVSGIVCTTNSPTSACVGASGLLNGLTYDVNAWSLADYHGYGLCHGSGSPSPCTAASVFAAGQSQDASDGTDMGADITVIDNAQTRTKYVCTTYCGTGPYTD